MVELEREFRRGFKSWSEKSSLRLRRELGQQSHDPLPTHLLARYLNARVLTPRDIPRMSPEHLKQLLEIDPEGWSALTITKEDCHIIIHNPTHPPFRQSSNIMHELAHIVASHEPSKMIMSADGLKVMRSFDQKQEDEAAWLSACLLLPREALLHIKQQRMSDATACENYSVTRSLLKYRMGVSGVNKQTSRWQ